MKRKILRIGKASLAVSIPSKWAKSNRLEAGKEMEIEEREGGLFLNTQRKAFKKEITIKAPEGDQFVRRVIISPYIQGYNTIHVTYKDPATRKKIENTLNHMLGFEIMTEKRESVTLQNVAVGVEDEFLPLLKRMFHLVNTMVETLKEAIDKERLSLLDELDSYDNTLTKLHNFCRRLLNTQSPEDMSFITSSYRIVCDLEGVGDTLKEIAEDLKERKEMPKIKEGLERAIEILSLTAEVICNPSLKDIARHRHLTKKANKWYDNQVRVGKGDPMTYIKLSDMSSRVRELTVEIGYPFHKN